MRICKFTMNYCRRRQHHLMGEMNTALETTRDVRMYVTLANRLALFSWVTRRRQSAKRPRHCVWSVKLYTPWYVNSRTCERVRDSKECHKVNSHTFHYSNNSLLQRAINLASTVP